MYVSPNCNGLQFATRNLVRDSKAGTDLQDYALLLQRHRWRQQQPLQQQLQQLGAPANMCMHVSMCMCECVCVCLCAYTCVCLMRDAPCKTLSMSMAERLLGFWYVGLNVVMG